MRAQKHVEDSQVATQNLVELLQRRAKESAKVAATHKRAGNWEDVTWGAILEEVKKISAGLIAQGIKPGDRVALFAATSLQWLVCDVAVAAARAITVPVYSSNTPDECRYILNHSESVLLFVDSDEADGKQIGRLSRVRQRLKDCPSVRKVIVFEGAVTGDGEGTLGDLVRQGEA